MGKMLTDHQYQQLMARSGGTNLSSQLLLAQSQPHRDQYFSRNLYPERAVAAAAADALYATGPPLAVGSSARYPTANRSDAYVLPSDAKDIRAQGSADRRPLLASAPLIDYPPQAYEDRIGSRAHAVRAMSPEGVPYPGQRGVLPLPTSAVASPSEILARARRTEIAPAYAGSYGNGARRLVASAYDDHEFPPVLPKVQAGFAKSDASRGRDMERYLLAVQPEKLVRYTAACLTSEPTLKRTRYSVMGSELNPEEDVYSNYRRAKTMRTGSHEFRSNSYETRSERESYRDKDRYRGREAYRRTDRYPERRRGDGVRDHRRSSPSRRSKNNSTAKNEGANRVGRLSNSSQSSEGKVQRNGDPSSGNRPSGNSERPTAEPTSQQPVPDQPSEVKPKEDILQESDEDSELGSLCADLSDSDEDKKKKPEEPAKVVGDTLAGMIFGCSSATFHECMKLQLFGLPAKNKEDVLRVSPGTKVFLFNFDTKELSGIFEAISHGGWQIDPEAFRDFGGFPSQVQVCCSEQCPNLTLSTFKPAIQDNYVNQHKFKFDLNAKQVKDLVRLFRQAARAQPRQRDSLSKHYSSRLQSEDYSMRGIQQQRPYSRHPQARFGSSRAF